ncbi:hypothetical protein [Nocardiopsis metallicus]|uniref:Uncharacterized protein n=1 Tax=Nocardiopsis metallicus TaxID=179819 RepID=A0A840WBJ4_9ACTN|nr:hypothetical protein [Nocardiopsis metallicus]MBB5493524.1 hypothetical protein [Nocardiopsis metallicus]
MPDSNNWLRSNSILGAALGVLAVLTVVFLLTLGGAAQIALTGVGVAGILFLAAKISQNRRAAHGSR